MNWLDLAVFGIVVLSAIFAFARGFAREALSIVAWGGAAYVTFVAYSPVYAMIETRVHERLLAQILTVFGVFVGSLLVLTIATSLLARRIRLRALIPVDRTLGFIFGLARGAFLVCLAFLLLTVSVPQQSEWPTWIRNARSTPYLNEGANVLSGFVPTAWRAKGADAYDQLLGPNGKKSAAEQAKEAIRAYAEPTPAAGAKPAAAAPPNYPADDRRTLNRIDRVIGTQR
jgi:membrane protein required for colicin V production